jgi:prepilin-type N-terminal cleavage/methylation domain-containing protein
MKYFRRTGRAGFTLVELLIVIAIIMVLIGMLLPVLNKVRQQANSTACLSNLRQMGIGVQYYLQDFKGTMPLEYDCDMSAVPIAYSDNLGDLVSRPSNYAGAFGAPYTVLAYLDVYYLHQPKLFICPAADLSSYNGGNNPLNPSYPYDYFRSDYGIAGYACSPNFGTTGGGQGGACFSYANPIAYGSDTFVDTWIRVTQIQDPSHRLMIADKGGQLFGTGGNTTVGGQNELIDIRRGQDGFNYQPGGVDNSARHGGVAPSAANPNTNAKVNFVCVDGHAETDTYANVQMPGNPNATPYIWLGPLSP